MRKEVVDIIILSHSGKERRVNVLISETSESFEKNVRKAFAIPANLKIVGYISTIPNNNKFLM